MILDGSLSISTSGWSSFSELEVGTKWTKGKFSVFVEHRIRVLDQSFISMEASFETSIFETFNFWNLSFDD